MSKKKKSSEKTVGVRLSKEEHEILKSKANKNKMTISKYIKERVFFDDVINKNNSLDFKILRTVSYCAGVLSKMADVQLSSDQEQEELKEEIKEIMTTNGINQLED